MFSKPYKSKKPCKRWFLGYSEFEIRTALPVQRVLEILSENVQPKRKLFQLKPKPFLGCVDSKEFVISYNSFEKLRVYGNISQEGEGSILVVTMGEDMEPIIAFSLFLVVAAAFLGDIRDISSLIHGLPFYGTVLLVLRIFFYLFFRFEAACVRKKLFRILK